MEKIQNLGKNADSYIIYYILNKNNNNILNYFLFWKKNITQNVFLDQLLWLLNS